MANTFANRFIVEDQDSVGQSELAAVDNLCLMVGVNDRINYTAQGFTPEIRTGDAVLAFWPNDAENEDYTTYAYPVVWQRQSEDKSTQVVKFVQEDGSQGEEIEIPTWMKCNGFQIDMVFKKISLKSAFAGKQLLEQ